jgi:arginyl-tRNA--protein-N-Asp/Glu arginylyltransferase
VKVKCQIDEQNPRFKSRFANIRSQCQCKACKKCINIRILDRNYRLDQKFKKYLDYHWVQKSVVQNITSGTFKRAKDQLSCIDCSYIFLPIACTLTQDIDLVWVDF